METMTSVTQPTFDLSHLNALTVLPYRFMYCQLILVGCGGTGSWLAPHIARLAKTMQDRLNKHVSISFVDPDTVESKNIYRQNFCQAEVGQNKAETLARRLGTAWGLDLAAFPMPIEDVKISTQHDELTILIGCVDSADGRIGIVNKLEHMYSANKWWLDCGNTQSYGQVLFGGGGFVQNQDPFALKGYVSALPWPSWVHKELLIASRAKEEQLSCADLIINGEQSLAVNCRVAAEAADYLTRFCLMNNLKRMATYMDLEVGSQRAVPILKESIEKWYPKKETA